MVFFLVPPLQIFLNFKIISFSLSVFLFEVFLSDAAGWACPVGREVFESCSGGYASFRISFCGVVDVSADDAYVSVHNFMSFVWTGQFNFQAELLSDGCHCLWDCAFGHVLETVFLVGSFDAFDFGFCAGDHSVCVPGPLDYEFCFVFLNYGVDREADIFLSFCFCVMLIKRHVRCVCNQIRCICSVNMVLLYT